MSGQRQVPLRLCEVLEKEFISLHGPLPVDYPGWELKGEQVNFPILQEALNDAPKKTPAGAILVRLKLNKPNDWSSKLATDSAIQVHLISELNGYLANGILYDTNLLDADTESRRLAELETKTETFSPAERLLVNRLLLEAAFPEAIKSIEATRLTAIQSEIHLLAEGRTALCLSGGGIRSGAFALGILQGLACKSLLDKFDYLSTVSGGGYVGSWLSAWIHRHPAGLTGVVKELSDGSKVGDGAAGTLFKSGPAPIRFLRSYSYFLNPKSGFFSADTWAWIGTYLRNLSLNWLALIPLLLLLLAVPRLYATLLSGDAFYSPIWPETMRQLAFWLATLSGVLTIVCITVNRPSISDPATRSDAETDDQASTLARLRSHFKEQHWILLLGVLPLVLFSCLVTLQIGGAPSVVGLTMREVFALITQTPLSALPGLLPYLALGSVVLWGELIVVIGWAISLALLPPRDWKKRLWELAVMLVAGLLTWSIVGRLAGIAALVPGTYLPILSFTLHPRLVYTILAGPATVAACLGGMTLFIGLVSKCKWIDDEDYEWWARFGGWLLIVSIFWAAAGVIVIAGPALLLEWPKLLAAVGGASGLLAVLLGKSSLTPSVSKNASPKPQKREMLAAFGVSTLALVALLFLAIFLAFLSLLTSALLPLLSRVLSRLPSLLPEFWTFLPVKPLVLRADCGVGEKFAPWVDTSVFSNQKIHLETICQSPPELIAMVMLVLLAIVLAAAFWINLNKFSLHGAYRNRLIRAFLGASRAIARNPNPFTGFDPSDNIQMHELQPGLLREGDLLDLKALVAALKNGLDDLKPAVGIASASKILVEAMISSGSGKDDILKSRLQHYEPGTTLLKSLQRDLIERLNRVLQSERLVEKAPFSDFSSKVEIDLRHGNPIFANRRLIEAVFGDWIRKYDFPPKPPHKLLHVVNLALNLVRGKNLAWQERKAASFIVSPMHSGCNYLGFRDSREFGGDRGISLGTAATISGAAVSPNMGYSSSPVVTLLLTLFNVRLGWWLGNPGIAGNKTHKLPSPRFSLHAVLSEALGMTDDQSPYVYLSDGGHFENLGIYEMVLRRCRLIVASDAGADPEYVFEDLANAVRKIRIDFGIPIEFDSLRIFGKKEDTDTDGCYCAIGRIGYSAVDDSARDGVLVYLKPVVYGKESRDILYYKAKNAAFPQETTSDQFFGESQFESYRRLGEFAMEQVCKDLTDRPNPAPDQWIAEFVRQASRHCGAESQDWVAKWLAATTRPHSPLEGGNY